MNKESDHLQMKIVSVLAIVITAAMLYFLFQAWQTEYQADRPEDVAETWDADRHVLFISSYHDTFATVVPQRRGLQQVFSKHNVSMDIEYMDTKNYDTRENEKLFYQMMRYKLANHNPYDAIIIGDDAALHFAEKYQQELFPETPIVFLGINDRGYGEKMAENPWMTGSLERYYMNETLDLMLRVKPGIRRVVVIYDETRTGMGDYSEFIQMVSDYPGLDFSSLNFSDMTAEELAAELRELPADSIVFFLVASLDRNGNRYSIPEATELIASNSPVPVLRQSEGGIGLGALGGKITDYEVIGRDAAKTVVEVLDGKDISAIPLMKENGEGRYVFDCRMLQRFGIPENVLPDGTRLLNARASYWMEHRAVLLPMLGIVAVLLMLLVLVYRNYMKIVLVRSELADTEQIVSYQSTYDMLTDLPNRQSAMDEMRRRLAEEKPFTAMIVDLDNFKKLNDFYSHDIANEILMVLADRLQDRFLKKNPGSFAARIGGDEFMLIVPGILQESDGEMIRQVLDIFHQPVNHGETKIPLTASIGIVCSTDEPENSADLMFGNADIALVEAKRAGKSGYRFYRSENKQSQRRLNEVEDILRDAIEKEAFTVFYQPQVDAQTKKLHGFEALARLSEAKIYPGEFIPIAESTGLIIEIGRIITKKVLEQIHRWKEEGLELYPVAINYSCGQLSDSYYPRYLAELMERYEVPAELIEIEVTESLFLGNNEQSHDLFLALAAKGIKMALDDFGTGYSALSYLTYLPVDVVKIDKSLVDTYLQEGTEDFMENLIKLLHSLSKTLVVEGVETSDQFAKLRAYHADVIQGYYFSRPLPADEAIRFDPEKIPEMENQMNKETGK